MAASPRIITQSFFYEQLEIPVTDDWTLGLNWDSTQCGHQCSQVGAPPPPLAAPGVKRKLRSLPQKARLRLALACLSGLTSGHGPHARAASSKPSHSRDTCDHWGRHPGTCSPHRRLADVALSPRVGSDAHPLLRASWPSPQLPQAWWPPLPWALRTPHHHDLSPSPEGGGCDLKCPHVPTDVSEQLWDEHMASLRAG